MGATGRGDGDRVGKRVGDGGYIDREEEMKEEKEREEREEEDDRDEEDVKKDDAGMDGG
jgi:hypothetical protein